MGVMSRTGKLPPSGVGTDTRVTMMVGSWRLVGWVDKKQSGVDIIYVKKVKKGGEDSDDRNEEKRKERKK